MPTRMARAPSPRFRRTNNTRNATCSKLDGCWRSSLRRSQFPAKTAGIPNREQITRLTLTRRNFGPPEFWPAGILARRNFGPPQKEEPRPLKAAGAQRRVIEGEGLGGFARRLRSIPPLLGGSCQVEIFFSPGPVSAGGAAVAGTPRNRLARPAKLAAIGRKLDVPPARKDDIPRDNPQLPVFAAVAFDDILGADRKTGRQGIGGGT